MTTRRAILIGLMLAIPGCGHKDSAPAPMAAKSEKGVSIENQAPPPDAPPPSPTPSAEPSVAPAATTSADNGEADNVTQKRYNRNMDWLRALKMGDEKKKQETAAAIKKANLSAKERVEFEELKAHYNVQYPVQY